MKSTSAAATNRLGMVTLFLLSTFAPAPALSIALISYLVTPGGAKTAILRSIGRSITEAVTTSWVEGTRGLAALDLSGFSVSIGFEIVLLSSRLLNSTVSKIKRRIYYFLFIHI